MQIHLLGSMSVRGDDGCSVLCGGTKQRAVLAQLALAPNGTVSVDRLAEGIWGETVPPRYRQNLQVYVSTLRRLLEPARPAGAPSRLVGHGEGYELVAADDEVDVSRFRTRLSAAAQALTEGRPQATADLCQEALHEWRGDPLADLVGLPFATDWLEPLHRDRLLVRELLTEALLALGRHQEVLPQLEELTTLFPEREHLWELLVTALARAGRQAEALDAIRRATRHLSRELGLDPGPALAALQARVLNHDPTLLGTRPPTVRVAAVPVPLVASIGREALVATVVASLEDHRLVVLTGPGGVGKTRTAQEAAAAAASPSARWVAFAAEPPGVRLPDAVARTLGCAVDDLADQLAAPGALLVMDNLEHVTRARDDLVAMLQLLPAVTVLASSRGPLGIAGEHVVSVPALDPASTAVELFVQRAQAVVPGYTGEDDHDVLVELCGRLDGLPLAIELAAARAAVLPPEDLLALLPDLEELRDPGATGRQSSVSALVQWSLGLLRPGERAALAALVVLAGSPDRLTTAVAVGAGLGRDAATPPLAEVESLVHRGLVQPVESPSGRRYSMLQTVRSVCLAAPPAGLAIGHGLREAVLSAVADRWLDDAAEHDFEEQVPARVVAALSDDLPLLRQVVQSLAGGGRPERATALLAARRRALALLGRQDVLLDLAGLVLARPEPGAWTAQARILAGSAAYVVDGPDAATPLLDAVEELAPEDTVHRVLGHCFRAVIAAEVGEHEQARLESERAIAVATRSGHRGMRLRAHSAAAWAATSRGDAAEVVKHGQAGLDLAADDTEVVSALVDLARGELVAAAAERALGLAQEAVQRGRRLGLGYVLCDALQILGFALLRVGQAGSARVVLQDAVRDFAPSDLGWQLETIAGIALARLAAGPDPAAVALLHDAGRASREARLGDTAVPLELEQVVELLGVDPVPPARGRAPSLSDLRRLATADGAAS